MPGHLQKRLWSPDAEGWSIQEATFQPLYEKVIASPALRRGSSVLDIGCGTGHFLQLVAEKGCSVAGIDVSSHAVELARRAVPGGTFATGEMERLPYPAGAFDVVAGNNSFQYSRSLPEALREVHRVLQPGGRLIVSLWGEPAKCDSYQYFKVFNRHTGQEDAYAVPFNLSSAGTIEVLMRKTGFDPGPRTDVVCRRYYPDLETAVKGILSSGPAQQAIANSAHDVVRAEVIASIAPFRQPDGAYSMNNHFFFLTGLRR